MKKIILSILAIALSVSLFAQTNLKDLIAIVRPVYPDATVSFLEGFSKSLNRDGYHKAAEYIDAYSKGGFGSGFVIADKNGKYYILTNKHVVQSAGHVIIEFVNRRDTLRYDKCKIVAIDNQQDIALVEFPKDAKISNSLSLSDTNIEDGIDVFTAGYPALGGSPLWQFGKGIISNSEVFMNDSNTCIQHTAQIDAGSSGGPLLIRSKENPKSYKVIGMNTWSAVYRENTNYSIPVSDIQSFLNKHLYSDDRSSKEYLENSLTKMISYANENDYKKVLPYISYSYINNIDVADFYDFINSAPDDVSKDIKVAFEHGMPLEGFRIALSSAICSKLKDKQVSIKSIDDFSNKKPVTVQLNYKQKIISSTWIFEQNTWRISLLANLKSNELGKNGIAKDFYYNHGFTLSYDPPSHDFISREVSISYIYSFSGKFFYSLSVGSVTLRRTFPRIINGKEIDVSEDEKARIYNAGIGYKLPIRINPVYILPNVQGKYGVLAGEFYYELSLGVQLAYKLHRNTYILGGIDFKHRKLVDGDAEKLLGINIGITF